jgi:hypothetical protein
VRPHRPPPASPLSHDDRCVRETVERAPLARGPFLSGPVSRILSLSSHPSVRPTWTSAGSLQTVLLGLASGGVCLAAVSPRRRCALTAPFHPCLCHDRKLHGRSHRRCVSVALSRGFPRVGSPTALPCDVRTFLEGCLTSAAAWPAEEQSRRARGCCARLAALRGGAAARLRSTKSSQRGTGGRPRADNPPRAPAARSRGGDFPPRGNNPPLAPAARSRGGYFPPRGNNPPLAPAAHSRGGYPRPAEQLARTRDPVTRRGTPTRARHPLPR